MALICLDQTINDMGLFHYVDTKFKLCQPVSKSQRRLEIKLIHPT